MKNSMKFSKDFKIVGTLVTLIPYKVEHVLKYHSWMENEEILRLTGSERLSLNEEYKMQQDWEEDINKCTFIILNNEKYVETGSEIDSIVGDTNLFFQECPSVAEIEVMVADVSARRRGFAKEALQLMMNFGAEKLEKTCYIAKIKQDNVSSINLFSLLGFRKVSESQVFNEFTFERHISLL